MEFLLLILFFSQLGVYYLRYSINNSKPPSLPGPGLLLLLIQFLALLPENRSKPIFYRLLFSFPLKLKDSQKIVLQTSGPRSISKSRHKALLTFPFLKQMHFECRALLQFREAESSWMKTQKLSITLHCIPLATIEPWKQNVEKKAATNYDENLIIKFCLNFFLFIALRELHSYTL